MSEDPPEYKPAPIIGALIDTVHRASTEEPEAAHLRDQLRRIQRLAQDPAHPATGPDTIVLMINNLATKALERPRTNGKVIDALKKENAGLKSRILDLEVAIHEAGTPYSSHAAPEAPEHGHTDAILALQGLQGRVDGLSERIRRIEARLIDRNRLFSLIHVLTGRKLR